MKTYVIGDIHNHVNWIETFLEENDHDQVIFLGDYFDNFGDTPQIAMITAQWLVRSVTKENRIHLMGNHDMPYRFPDNPRMKCPGWDTEKHQMVKQIFDFQETITGENPWNKIKLAHFDHEHQFIFSHAGLTEKLFKTNPIHGPELESHERKIDNALSEYIKNRLSMNPVALQNADYTYDGITWIRPSNIRLITGVTQVVGHTPCSQLQNCSLDETTPLIMSKNGGKMWNIDCVHHWVGVYQDGVFYAQHRFDEDKVCKEL